MWRRTAVGFSAISCCLALAAACSSSSEPNASEVSGGAGGMAASGPDASLDGGVGGEPSSGAGGQPSGGTGVSGQPSGGATAGVSGQPSGGATAGGQPSGGAESGAAGEMTAGAGGESCIDFVVPAPRSSGALMLALDASASMTTNQKWQTLQTSVVTALDADLFDATVLGVNAYPSGYVTGPACVFGFQVACGASGISVAPSASGLSKSSAASGVRHDIYEYLVERAPLSNDNDDGSPAYPALAASINALKQASAETRALVWITDGSPNCASVSDPTRPGYSDSNDCPDWEEPNTLTALIHDANLDAAAPIQTFVIGIPGSNSTTATNGTFPTAPYSMLLALSTLAVAGAPDFVDQSCDKTSVFTQSGVAPAKPCHLDLSGNSFSPSTLAAAIDSVGARALGCVFDLPQPPQGQTLDTERVNPVTHLGSTATRIPKRTTPTDACTDGVGCWDYRGTSQIVLWGAACPAPDMVSQLTLDLEVGCTSAQR
jgi:hypothetical protein